MRKLMTVLVGTALTVVMTAGAAIARVPTAATGTPEKSVEEILADSTAALQSASSVLMTGTATTDGRRVSINLVAGHGQGGGSMFIDGVRFRLVLAGTDVYLRTAVENWAKFTGYAGAGEVIGDRWVKVTTANENFRTLAQLLDIDQLAVLSLTPTGVTSKGAVERFRGKPAVPIHDDDPNEPGTLYVAAKGAPYPLAIVSTAGKGQTVFSKFNKAKVPQPPTDFFDMTELQ
jgi:hypothetical protein